MVRKFAVLLAALAMFHIAICSMNLELFEVRADVEQTTLSVNYSEVAGERGLGVSGALPFSKGIFVGNAEADLNAGGELIRGTYHVEAGVNIKGFDLLVYTDGTLKGYTLDALGRESRAGFDAESRCIPIGDFTLAFSIGVYGRNGGRLTPINAAQILKNAGVNPDTLDKLPALAAITPDPPGLTMPLGNAGGVAIGAELVHTPTKTVVKIKGLPQLLGKGDKAHLLMVSPHLLYGLGKHVNLSASIDYRIQILNGRVQRELAANTGIDIVF